MKVLQNEGHIGKLKISILLIIKLVQSGCHCFFGKIKLKIFVCYSLLHYLFYKMVSRTAFSTYTKYNATICHLYNFDKKKI